MASQISSGVFILDEVLRSRQDVDAVVGEIPQQPFSLRCLKSPVRIAPHHKAWLFSQPRQAPFNLSQVLGARENRIGKDPCREAPF